MDSWRPKVTCRLRLSALQRGVCSVYMSARLPQAFVDIRNTSTSV